MSKPILFGGAMVRAILSGAKTQTRRAIKPQPFEASALDAPGQYRPSFDESGRLRIATSSGVLLLACPFGQPGDRMWVRERFKPVASGTIKNGYGEVRYGYAYEADSSTSWNRRTTIIHDLTGQPSKGPMQFQQGPWKPAICMPHRACRLVLEITAVRVERLQALQEADWESEGVSFCMEDPDTAAGHAFNEAEHYAIAGVSMRGTPEDHGMRAQFAEQGLDWDSNPWVWVIEFKLVEPANG
ncbi:MAG: hypothetical protein KH046_00600 [Stenotrophomonas maltophilia]|nr:hypothetical protein [Stenotrophomonas maltophilia]